MSRNQASEGSWPRGLIRSFRDSTRPRPGTPRALSRRYATWTTRGTSLIRPAFRPDTTSGRMRLREADHLMLDECRLSSLGVFHSRCS
ncbi:hypothetical protein CTA1_5523 [Colletotrichum tanaceti]|uniref:Uncharacterized protein n=1 Tax=Colletotrichum tanaceti TaxID=1306861 RepID=A0A4U6X1C6_9PEZI|nr:hypothetical protein CTA1_5523 [Colletotrichum tanaceti]